MFQPQATPYSVFSSFGTGVGVSVGDFPAFQPNRGVEESGGSLVVDSGFPVIASNNINHSPLNYHDTTNHTHIPSAQYNKMPGHDMEAQELAAQEFERDRKFEVCLQF